MQRTGYRHGLHEPTLVIRLDFASPPAFDPEPLDALMSGYLGVPPSPPPDGQGGRPEVALAWRILLVGRALRQAGRLPVFDAGRILAVSAAPAQPGAFKATVAVPTVDGIPEDATASAYRAATALVLRAARPGCTHADLAPLCAQVDDRLIRRLQAVSAAGISTLPILRAARERDIPCRRLVSSVWQLGWGFRAQTLDRSAIGDDSAIGRDLSTRKDVAAELLRAAGLPAPEHLRVASEDHALKAAARLGWPVVVKPADLDRSEGVTVNVDTPAALLAAYRRAAALSPRVLVERHVPGICYRLLVANGEFLYAISREPVAIVGDGARTVAELLEVRAEADRRRAVWRRVKAISLDDETLAVLAGQGLRADSRPEAGRRVALRTIESSEWGGEIADASARVHPDNIDVAVRAARLFGLSNAGIDLISPDIARPWHENGAVVNELNFAPYFGGNAVAQSRLPRFLQALVPGDGRIPVEVYVGGRNALARALERQRRLAADGTGAHLTTDDATRSPTGEPLQLAARGAFARVLALLSDRATRHLVVVLQSDEWLRTGSPVDRLVRLEAVHGPGGPPAKARQALVDALRPYLQLTQDTPPI